SCAHSTGRATNGIAGSARNGAGSSGPIGTAPVSRAWIHSSSYAATGSGKPFRTTVGSGRNAAGALRVSAAAAPGTSTTPPVARAGGRLVAQPRRLDDGRPEDVVVFDRDLTSRDPDPCREGVPFAAGLVAHAVLHRDRGRECVGGAVEEGEGAVAQRLHDPAA